MKMDTPFVLGVGEVLWDMLPEGKRCGGAPANVVYHLTQLGIPGFIVSAAGCDVLGNELLNFLQSKGISTDFISRNDFPTGTVDVTLKNGIPSYDIHQPAAWDHIAIPQILKDNVDNVSCMIWGTLAQREPASSAAIRELLETVSEDCLKCFDINLRQNYYDREMIDRSLRFADVLKINGEEVDVTAKLFHISGSTKDVLKHLYRQYSLQYIICTLGADGSMLYDGKIFTEYPVKKCRIVDTVGCGDAFLAAWCAAVLQGKSAADGMTAGTELASFVASRAGAMPDKNGDLSCVK